MGAKSRGNWSVGMCLKDCTHQGVDDICGSCLRFSNWNNPNPAIIEDKDTTRSMYSHKESMRFYPHYNEAFGKYISTKGEYLSEMKKGGYEPYSGEAPKIQRQKPDERPTRDVLNAIERCSNKDGSFNPGSNLTKALLQRGVIMTKDSRNAYINKVKEMQRG